MRAFVLAAGLGTRLGPLREVAPKALLPVGGIPLIRFALAKLRRAGAAEAAVNLHHGAEAVRNALGERAEGLALSYSFEPQILGTAGGLKKMEAYLREGGGPFFVLNADAPSGADLAGALAHHLRGGFLATLVLRESPDAERFGILAVDEAGRLRRFIGHSAPGLPRGRMTEAVFTGASVLSPEFLDHIPAGRPCDIAAEVYPALIESGAPIGAVLMKEYWADAGTPARYLEVNADLLAGRFLPDMTWPEGGRLLAGGASTAWGEGHLLPPVLLGPDAVLARGAVAGPFTVLGRGVTLSEGASAARTILFPEARVAKGVRLERCIVGPGGIAESSSREAVFLAGEHAPRPFEGPA